MKMTVLFLKTQLMFFTILLLFISIPFVVISLYMPKVPYLFYLFSIIILALKFIVFDEKRYSTRIKKPVIQSLTKEEGKVPSNDKVFKRIKFMVLGRDIALGINFLILLISAMIFQKL
jgi:hypothetical protein